MTNPSRSICLNATLATLLSVVCLSCAGSRRSNESVSTLPPRAPVAQPASKPSSRPAAANPSADEFAKWTNQLQDDAVARRSRRLAELKTPADVEAWQRDLRAWYRKRVGPLPELSAPMRREHASTIACDGYRVEKWLFEVASGTMTAANLYVPDKPHPAGVAIVAPLGHWPQGKSNGDYQNLGAYMALNGITVLTYDHPGAGERREFWDPIRNESRTGKSATTEHDCTGDIATLAGIQPVRFYLTDIARAVDFLATFDFVRRDRIGVSGASGGGALSRYAAAYLDNLAFSIPVCSIREEKISSGGDAEQNCWSVVPQAAASGDFLAAMAPRPAMIVTEHQGDGSADSYATLRRIYDIAGAPTEATEYAAIADRHGYTRKMIEPVYRFLARNYGLPPAKPDSWAKARKLTRQEAEITPGGFLYRDRPQLTVLDQIARLTPPATEKLTRARLAEALRIADWKRASVAYAFVAATGASAAQVAAPTAPHEGIIRITSCTTATPGELGLLDWSTREPDPEGDQPDGNYLLFRSPAAARARSLLAFDRSLVGLRTRQILDFLEDHKGKVQRLEASGEWSIPLAFAAALADPDLLPSATVRQFPARFRDILTAEVNTTGLASFPTGFLLYGDLDDVIALAGPRLKVEGRTNPGGRVIAP